MSYKVSTTPSINAFRICLFFIFLYFLNDNFNDTVFIEKVFLSNKHKVNLCWSDYFEHLY